MLVFGGYASEGGSSRPSNDVWALSLTDTTWHDLTPSGTSPAGRVRHSAINDLLHDRMMILGGDPTPTSPPGASHWGLPASGARSLPRFRCRAGAESGTRDIG